MRQLSRREFLAVGALGLLGSVPSRVAQASCPAPAGVKPLSAPAGAAVGHARTRFAAWVRDVATARPPGGAPLVVEGPLPDALGWASLGDSAYFGLWMLARGTIRDAEAIARRMLPFQQGRHDAPLARSFGAFPDWLEYVDETWRPRAHYSAGTNMVVLSLLVALAEQTADRDFVNAAIGIGTWLSDVMCRGDQHGAWVEAHGAPMAAVTRAGDLTNHILADDELLWLSALGRLGTLTGEAAYCARVERALAFYASAQHAKGGFFERYDPGSPPQPFDRARWQATRPGVVRATRTLRAALGVAYAGDLDAGRRTLAWIRRKDAGVAAWLDLESGAPADGEPRGDDVLATGLYRALAAVVGDATRVRSTSAELVRWQRKNGGFPLGVEGNTSTSEQSTQAGVWATLDVRAAWSAT